MNIANSRAASLGNPSDPFSLTTQTDTETVNGRTYKSVFTASTRTFVDTTPAGRKTTSVLDALERIASIQPPAGTLTSFTYDSRGRLASATQGARQTIYSYDENGRLTSLTNPLSQTESFTYDDDGRLLTQTLEDGREINYAYDNNGNLTSVTPPGTAAHGFTYSSVNLPVSYSPPVVNGGWINYLFLQRRPRDHCDHTAGRTGHQLQLRFGRAAEFPGYTQRHPQLRLRPDNGKPHQRFGRGRRSDRPTPTTDRCVRARPGRVRSPAASAAHTTTTSGQRTRASTAATPSLSPLTKTAS